MDGIGAQIGVYGIFALMLIKALTEMLKAAKSKNGNGSKTPEAPQVCKDIKEMTIETLDKVKGLHSMHNKTDSDGLPVWYMPRSMVKAQQEIAKTQEQTTIHLKSLADSVKELCEKQRR